MDSTLINEYTKDFFAKIHEAINKYQSTLPTQLPEEEIKAIKNLLKEYVRLNFIMGRNSYGIDLSSLLFEAINTSSRNPVGERDICNRQINKYISQSKRIIESSHILSDPIMKLNYNIPYLALDISDSSLKIKNHRNQLLYTSDEDEKLYTDNFYFVKSHAEVARERANREEKREEYHF